MYSYLLVDLRPEQVEDIRLRTNIFPAKLVTSRPTCRKNERLRQKVGPICHCWAHAEDRRQGEEGVRLKRRQEFVDCVSECAKNIIQES